MIINRRTSFTNLEYPNPFEDPEWTTWASIPNKEAVATASAGQSIAYKVPDGASGWYAMRVVPSGTDANSKVCASWGYTYLHEGSVVYLWCNNGSTPALSRKSLGANGSGGALGGAAGVVCGFKETSDVGDENYGTYSTHMPVVVAPGTYTFRRWKITFSDGRETIRYTKGSANWDPNTSATAAIYCLINNAPCLSFEDPSSIMGATGATVTDDGTETFDGIYLGTTPMEFYSTGFSAVAGLIVGQSGSANGLGGGALGSSTDYAGSTGTFGAAPSDNSNGGIAFFDFSREVFESNERKELSDSETAGAYLYKTTEEGHDTTEPYAQRFTAPASLENCEFTFYVNGTEYEFPTVWPDANKQRAFTGDYVTYITGVHLGDTLTVVAEYASGKKAGGIYTITMHSLVYGLYLGRYEFLWKEAGDYSLVLPGGTYQTYVHGAGGAGGETGGSFYRTYSTTGGVGGRGGKGLMKLYSFTLPSDTETEVHVGSAGLTYSNGGNGGARGIGDGSRSSGAGGGGGEPSYVLANDSLYVGEGGGGGGGGGGSPTNNLRFDKGGPGGAGGGYYRVKETEVQEVGSVTNRNVYLYYDLGNWNVFPDTGRETISLHEITAEQYANNNYGGLAFYIPTNTELYVGYSMTNVWPGSQENTSLYVTDINNNDVTFMAKDTVANEERYLTINNLLVPGEVTSELYTIESVAGKDGTPASNYGATGANGIAGNQDIPVYSGKGGNGTWAGGGAIATGGGASGSAGGGGPGNENTGAGGTGGGGAGGCLDAGGGGNATNTAYSAYNSYIYAYNAGAVVPTYSENYLGETVTSGWGMGGTTNMNGTDGWVYLVRCEDVTAYLNLGSVFLYTPTDVSDAGLIDEPDDEQADASLITDPAGWTKYSMYQLASGFGPIMKYDDGTFLTYRQFTDRVNIGSSIRPNYQTRYYFYCLRGAATWSQITYMPYTTNGMMYNTYVGVLYHYNGNTNIVGALIYGRSDGAIQTGPQSIMTLSPLSGYFWNQMFYKNGSCHLFGYAVNGGAYHIAKFTNGQPDPVITAIPSLTSGNWRLWIYAPTINQENGGAVVCLDPTTRKVCISQDSDGLTWSEPVTALPQGHNWNNLNFIGIKNLLVITSSDKYLSVSSDGINWSEPVYDPETPAVPMYYESASDCIVGAKGNAVSSDRTYRRIKADELTTINKLDAGGTLIPVSPTDYITCGSVEDDVTDIQDMGNIIGDLNG